MRFLWLFLVLATTSSMADEYTICGCPSDPSGVPAFVKMQAAAFADQGEMAWWGVRTNCCGGREQYFVASEKDIFFSLWQKREGNKTITPVMHFEFPEGKLHDGGLGWMVNVHKVLEEAVKERSAVDPDLVVESKWHFCGPFVEGRPVLASWAETESSD